MLHLLQPTTGTTLLQQLGSVLDSETWTFLLVRRGGRAVQLDLLALALPATLPEQA